MPHRTSPIPLPLRLAAAALLAVLAAWVHRAALLDIAALALRHTDQSHLLVVPFAVAWLVYLRRSRFRGLPLRSSWIGVALVAAGGAISVAGFRTDTLAGWHAGALLAVVGAVVTLLGTPMLRRFAPAFLALAFLVPVPGVVRQALAGPLQSMVTEMTESTLALVGVAAERAGNVLLINGEPVAVAEACNGLRMIFALVLVIYTFAFSLPLRPGPRLLLLACTPPTVMVCNVIRMLPTTLFFGFGRVDHAEMFHDLAGWLMLPMAVLLLLGAVRLVRWLDIPLTTLRLVTR